MFKNEQTLGIEIGLHPWNASNDMCTDGMQIKNFSAEKCNCPTIAVFRKRKKQMRNPHREYIAIVCRCENYSYPFISFKKKMMKKKGN